MGYFPLGKGGGGNGGEVDLSQYTKKKDFNDHVQHIANKDNLGHVKVDEAKGIGIDEEGTLFSTVEGGEGKVKTVNTIEPDETGNIDLGPIETPTGAQDKVDLHSSDKENPHEVTKEQVGLGNLLNEKQATDSQLKAHEGIVGNFSDSGHVKLSSHTESTSSVSDGVAATPLAVKTVLDYAKEEGSKIDSHVSDVDNPHSVTKMQIGLGDVDNAKQATKAEFDTHTKQIASADNLGHVKVGAGLSISDDGSLSVKRVPKLFNTYTVIIDETNSNPETALTYADDAVNMQPKSNEFLEFLGAKPCLLKAGKVVGYLNPNDFSKFEDGSTADITSGDAGDVMIEFPKRGINIQRRGTNLYVSMTDELDNPSFSYLAHTKGDKQVDNIYIGAYKGFELDGKLRSLSGKIPTGTKTIAAFRNIAQANGEGYQQSQWYHLTYRLAALVIYGKNLNGRELFGVGRRNTRQITGVTDDGGLETSDGAVKVFGIEDFWGNSHEWIDGVYQSDDRTILTATQNFNKITTDYLNKSSLTPPPSDGFPTKVFGDMHSGFIMLESGGSATTYYSSYSNQAVSSARVMRYGVSLTTIGAFNLDFFNTSSGNNPSIGARLSYS